jgi:hypothetical protein
MIPPLHKLPGGNVVTEFRRKWTPLIIAAAYSLALLVPALMPSVQAKDALPPLGSLAFTDNPGGMDSGMTGMGPSEEVMAALHEQASAALRNLQMASAAAQP